MVSNDRVPTRGASYYLNVGLTMSELITIGCKLPNGHILEVGTGEGRRTVKLNGANTARIVGGYGFTEVEKDFWDAWLKKNAGLEFVRKGMLFAHKTPRDAEAEAEERAGERSGFERLNPMDAPKGIVPEKSAA